MSSSSDSVYTFVTVDDMQADENSGVVGEMELVFENIRAGVPGRDILTGVSGSAKSGELTMLAGASGAGKSTLFNLLAKRAVGIESSGTVSLNGAPFDLAMFQAQAAYVTQDATFFADQTVEEVLHFAAQMRSSSGSSKEARDEQVDRVISLLRLEDVRETRVGLPGVSKGLSTTQRKMLNVGASLVTSPAILFADEPTTGLDARQAKEIMRALRDVAHETGIIVFCTIHQPSVFVWSLFDHAMVMALGQIAYAGPVSGVVPHLASLGYPCPKAKNPAEHMIGVLDARAGSADAVRVQGIIDAYAGQHLEEEEDDGPRPRTLAKMSSEQTRPGRAMRIYLLTWRVMVQTWRNKQAFGASIMQTAGFGLLLGILYFQLGVDQDGVVDRAGFLFFAVTNALFLSLQGSALTAIFERPVFFRESADGLYGTAEYVVAKTVANVPFQILQQVAFLATSLFLTGIRFEGDAVPTLLLALVLMALVGSTLGLAVSGIAPTASVATALGPFVVVPSMIFSGQVVTVSAMPSVFAWMRYTTPLRWGLHAIAINQLSDLTASCTKSERLPSGECPISFGEQVLTFMNAREDGVSNSVRFLVLFGWWVAAATAAYGAFAFSLIQQRKAGK